METVVNYNSGQVSGFYYGGVQVGWNGGASGSVYSGYVYGLNGSNSNYSGGFTGFNGGAGPGVFENDLFVRRDWDFGGVASWGLKVSWRCR